MPDFFDLLESRGDPMDIRRVETVDQAKQVFPIISALRPHLDEAEYLELLTAAKRESKYILLGAYEGDHCLGLAGYRILHDFVHGKHLYLDDLVVKESDRSKGIGTVLLEYVENIAKENDCKGYRLCTGKDNNRGKSFYERNNLDFRAVVYKAKF